MAQRPAGRRGSAQLTWLWMILALGTVAAFLVWITAVSEPTPPVSLEEDQDTTEADAADAAVPPLALADLQSNPGQHTGVEYRIPRAEVVSQLSGQTYWIELPNGNPFLIRADSAARGTVTMQAGSAYGLVGQIHLMNDSTLAAWEEAGVLENDDQRLQAEFAEAFMDVRRVRAAARQESSGEDGA